jgi:outer membrane protein insertion porin family
VQRFLCSVVFGILFFCAQASVAADSADLQGRPVTEIRILGPKAESSEAASQIDIRVSDRFSIQAVRHAIKVLYATGLFGQVRVSAFEAGEGVRLVFHLVPQRRVVAVETFGNEVLSQSDLDRLSRVSRGDEFDRWKLESSVSDMLDAYRQHGYRRTRIVPRVLGPEEGDVEIRIYVQEGPPTRVSKFWFRGKPMFDAKTLETAMDVEAGMVLDEERLQKAVKKLRAFYHRQGYLEARLVTQERDSSLEALWEVVPIEVEAGERITLRFEGNEVLGERELLSVLDFEKELSFGETTLMDFADLIEDHYREKGYAKVNVTPWVNHKPGERRKEVIFFVEEGSLTAVKRIEFVGNHAFQSSELQKIVEDSMADAIPQSLLGQPVDRGDVDVLSGGHPIAGERRRPSRPQGFLFDLVPENVYLREPYEKALAEIADLYHSQGYRDVQVGAPLLFYDGGGSNLYVTIPVQEGPQIRIGSISFGGNQVLDSTFLLNVAGGQGNPVTPGGPLDLYAIEELRRVFVKTYASKGYLYCQVQQQTVYDEDGSRADIHYVFSEGPQVKIRRVLVRGNILTAREVFEKTMSLQSGETLTPEKLIVSQEDLMDLGIFSGVDIKLLDPEHAEEEKDVVAYVRERLPHAATGSLGISSAEGVRLEVGYSHVNLFGVAMELVGRAKVNYQVFYPFLDEELRSRYEEMSFFEGMEWWLLSGLHWPKVWWLGRNVSARVDLIGMQDHALSYDLTKVSITPALDIRLGAGFSLSLQYEVEYNDLSCTVAGQTCGGATGERWMRYDQGTLLLGSFKPELSWDRRDNPFRPRRGTLVSFRPELANRLTQDSPMSFVKLDGLVSVYFPVGRESSLALSARAGAILHWTKDSRTPSHKLFFLGGRNTVRGYAEEALIPQDLNPPCIPKAGDTTQTVCVSPGGNAYVNYKAEFRFPLIPETLEGALFLDAGNLWMQASGINPGRLRSAAGFGLRVVTPIGPVALDAGINLDPDPDRHEDLWNLHFNIGVF